MTSAFGLEDTIVLMAESIDPLQKGHRAFTLGKRKRTLSPVRQEGLGGGDDPREALLATNSTPAVSHPSSTASPATQTLAMTTLTPEAEHRASERSPADPAVEKTTAINGSPTETQPKENSVSTPTTGRTRGKEKTNRRRTEGIRAIGEPKWPCREYCLGSWQLQSSKDESSREGRNSAAASRRRKLRVEEAWKAKLSP